MSAKHTPGPWFAKFEAGRYVISYQGEFGPHRALAITGGFQPDNAANARLIAAAPELLEALQAVDVLFGHLATDSTQRIWVDNARAAIAKATTGV